MLKKILIIEDDPDILDMMAYSIRDEGFEVTAALDCEPLKEVVELKPDLILLDNRLGDGSGANACKQLKNDIETAHIRVVLVSANMQLEQMTADSLADGFLAKPFYIDELVSVVRHTQVIWIKITIYK